MEKVLEVKNKNKGAFLIQSRLPYKYIPGLIDEYLSDIKSIEKIIVNEKDKIVLKLCKKVKNRLLKKLEYFRTKLANIPNKKYLEESDEEFVDKYM